MKSKIWNENKAKQIYSKMKESTIYTLSDIMSLDNELITANKTVVVMKILTNTKKIKQIPIVFSDGSVRTHNYIKINSVKKLKFFTPKEYFML
jgi:hypothetical protein